MLDTGGRRGDIMRDNAVTIDAMEADAGCSPATLAILQDARAMQTFEGARMIRRTAKALSKLIAHLFHVHPIVVERTTLG